MKKFIFPLFIAALFASTASQACWKSSDKARMGFGELDGTMSLSLRDAVNCTPIRRARVTLAGTELKSDHNGEVKFSMEDIAGTMDGTIVMMVEAEGYITLETDVKVEVGTIVHNKFTMSREIPIDQVRFVLQWSDRPRDLDLHLVGPGMHISFRKTRSIPDRAMLDRDDRDGFGPETITLLRVDPSANYQLLVDNYSGTPRFQGNARVDVYANGKHHGTIPLDETRSRAIKVLELSNNKIEELNQPISGRP